MGTIGAAAGRGEMPICRVAMRHEVVEHLAAAFQLLDLAAGGPDLVEHLQQLGRIGIVVVSELGQEGEKLGFQRLQIAELGLDVHELVGDVLALKGLGDDPVGNGSDLAKGRREVVGWEPQV